jgi:hypothetical protein
MQNLAGNKEADKTILEELYLANIPAIKVEKDNYIKLINDAFHRRDIFINHNCIDLINELGTLRRNKHGKEHASDSNHAADSFLYAFKQARNIVPVIEIKKSQEQQIEEYIDQMVIDRLSKSPEDQIMERMYRR